MTNGVRAVETGLHRVMRRLHNIERRIGTPSAEIEIIEQRALAGSGPFCYDYLVDIEWGGPEGKEFTTLSGHTFKVYSTIQAAVTDAEGTTKNNPFTFFICSGSYVETVTINRGNFANSESLYFYGSGSEATEIGPNSGNAFSINGSATLTIYLQDLLLGRNSTGSSIIETTLHNMAITARNVIFKGLVQGTFTGCYFSDCEFRDRGPIQAGSDDWGTVVFDHCEFGFATAATWAGAGGNDILFNACVFGGAQDRIEVTDGNWDGIQFVGCTLNTGGTAKRFFLVNGASATIGGLVFDGCDMGVPPDDNGVVYLQDGVVNNFRVTDCQFEKNNAVQRDYIASDLVTPATNCAFIGNTFGRDGVGAANYNEEEDPTSSSIRGNFDESVFGPNAPATIVQYDITGTNNEFYPGESAIGSSTSLRISRYQSATFAIDSTGIKTITTAHGLSTTPNIEDIQLTIHEETDVDDWGFDLLKVDSVDATNVVAKVNVSTASATGGATARLGILVIT